MVLLSVFVCLCVCAKWHCCRSALKPKKQFVCVCVQVRCTRKVTDLWWSGLPPSVRGRVWVLALGNGLHVTPQLYRVYHQE